MTTKLFEELKETPEFKKTLEKMSDEERRLAEKASEELLRHFEENILVPLRNSLKK
jgi:hypothetical protein